MNNDRWAPLKSRLTFFYLPALLSLLAILIFLPFSEQSITNWIGKIDFNYAINQAQIISYALKLSFLPINLIFDYDFTQNWFTSVNYKWLPAILWLSLIGLIFKFFKNLPVVISFSILWYILHQSYYRR